MKTTLIMMRPQSPAIGYEAAPPMVTKPGTDWNNPRSPIVLEVVDVPDELSAEDVAKIANDTGIFVGPTTTKSFRVDFSRLGKTPSGGAKAVTVR